MNQIQIPRSELQLNDFELKRAVDVFIRRFNYSASMNGNPIIDGGFCLDSLTFWYESEMSFDQYRNDPSHRECGEPKMKIKCGLSGAVVSEFFCVGNLSQLLNIEAVYGHANQTLWTMFHEWLVSEEDVVWRKMMKIFQH